MGGSETHAAVSITVVRVDALTLAEQDFARLFDLVRGGEEPLHVVARATGRLLVRSGLRDAADAQVVAEAARHCADERRR